MLKIFNREVFSLPIYHMDLRRKFNVIKMFERHSGRLLNVLCTFIIYCLCQRGIFFIIPVPGCFCTNPTTKYMFKVTRKCCTEFVLIVFKVNNGKTKTKKFFPASIYLFNVNNRNSRKRYEICSKLTTKKSQWRRCRSGVFIINFEHISHLFLEFLLLTLNKYMLAELFLWHFLEN